MTEKFEAWGIVEIMGHMRVAGRLSEQVVAGANLLRVDIPESEEDKEKFRTTFFGPSAIYALHITDETIARTTAAAGVTRPTYEYAVEDALRRLQAPAREHATDFDDD
jgi:hypothetical protein